MGSVNKKVITMAVIMALLTSLLIYVYIKKATLSSENIEYVNVFVASKTLPTKHMIVDSDIKQVKITKEYLNDKAILKKEDIIGKRLKDSIIEGEQILRDRLAGDNKLALAYNVPDKKRAVSINVTEQVEVANLIKPGDFVDVIASFDKEEPQPRVTKTIIQNVQILALGQEQYVLDDKNKDLPKTVTLAVSPQDAEKLVYASDFAMIRLSLRSVGDNGNVDTGGIIRSDMITR